MYQIIAEPLQSAGALDPVISGNCLHALVQGVLQLRTTRRSALESLAVFVGLGRRAGVRMLASGGEL
jgi:hypothetical protein